MPYIKRYLRSGSIFDEPFYNGKTPRVLFEELSDAFDNYLLSKTEQKFEALRTKLEEFVDFNINLDAFYNEMYYEEMYSDT